MTKVPFHSAQLLTLFSLELGRFTHSELTEDLSANSVWLGPGSRGGCQVDVDDVINPVVSAFDLKRHRIANNCVFIASSEEVQEVFVFHMDDW